MTEQCHFGDQDYTNQIFLLFRAYAAVSPLSLLSPYLRISDSLMEAAVGPFKVKSLSHVQLFLTQWTVAYQASPSIGFSRQEYWSGLPFPSPGDLPDPGIEPRSSTLEADALRSEPPGKSVL